ncbi:AAA family ATPase [Streptomyces sp. NPDC002659]|uniref:helix-turn-helix transcriptional regulator n=1 Tax=Streptomyces sp. NPDC002659 TaxID=3364656 RepID=UPI0036A8F94B
MESAAVARAVKEVTQGGGGLLLVEGPAGIGKTRLLAQARAAATEAGFYVAAARASELERDFAFGVVRQLFEPLLAGADSAGREALWQGPAAQARRVFTTADPATQPTGDFAVLHGLYWLTANTSQDHPLVLLLDDLQWCDTPSLRYLAYLLPRIEDQGILVAAALRTGEAAGEERLLQQIITDPAATVLRPHPLSARATALLLERELPGAVNPRFAAACHEATGGNPLLLRELARTLTAENVKADTENVTLVRDLGSRAVARMVAARMTRLQEPTIAVARAAAILGGNAGLTNVAALAGQDITTALEAASALERLQILRPEQHGTEMRLAYIHPLVQAAVHDSINHAERTTAHHHAARLLTEAGADPERIAAHLLHVPPAGDPEVVGALQAAAAQAVGRGAPEGAYTYLHRALTEPPGDSQRLQILIGAGQTAVLIDVRAAVEHFQQAYASLQDSNALRRAEIAAQYGAALLYAGRIDECGQVLTDSIAQLPPDEQDLRRRLHAWQVMIVFNLAGHERLRAHVTALHDIPPHASGGGSRLDCALALQEALHGDPRAVSRARRGLGGGDMFEIADTFTSCAMWALISAGAHECDDLISARSGHVHRRGDITALTSVYTERGRVWLDRGHLADAAADLHEALHLMEMTSLQLAGGIIIPYLAESLMEQGLLDQAASALDQLTPPDGAPSTQIAPYFLAAQAQLLHLQGMDEQALHAALDCQDQCAAVGLHNPAFNSWRTWAALSLHHLARTLEARTLAADDLRLARQWGAPRTIGRALRINGLLHNGTEQLDLLQQAITVLERSTARLEHAKALADYGAALRRAGHRRQARPPLHQALDLATRCGATPLADLARTELATAGGRPRHTALTGPDALTPSEHRIAELAASGTTNRQIAQTLYVTPKTVEVHLSSTYRKLGITTRTQLPAALSTP